MSKRKRQRSLPPTQNASSLSSASLDDGSDEEDHVHNIQNAVKECARYILSREGSKIPIKKADIAKHLATACQTPPQHVSGVISAAEKLLKKVYGYKLVSIKGKSGVLYIVVLAEECESLPSNVSESELRTMLMASLTHIFMSGGSVKEDDLWKFLSEAGLLEENDFAGRKAFIATFTRQLYLSFTKVGDGDLAWNVFEWGQRAHQEVPKMFLLQKMAEAFEKTPDHWAEQYKQATETNTAAAS
ncbi:non-structural maintenance of chromosomes element 3 homolog [Cydia strobilella]|uniref:non-structural maintenance of chromosomes element 3 homolog n=1 Tax=Cydia strobilella TaxID=1100964 RepID=UPI00300632D6